MDATCKRDRRFVHLMFTTIQFITVGLFISIANFQSALAGVKTAVRSGDWNDWNTWQTSIPNGYDDAIIPANITVTIRAGQRIDNLNVDLSGNLIIDGAIQSRFFETKEGSTVTMRTSGTLISSQYLQVLGKLQNAGKISVFKDFHNHGSLVNEISGLIEVQGNLLLATFDKFLNFGTLSVNGVAELSANVENYGIIQNIGRGAMRSNASFFNQDGATLINEGDFTNFYTLINNGLIINSGRKFQNNGTIKNLCTGVLNGNQIGVNPPVFICDSPWRYIGSGTAFHNISVASNTQIVATSSTWSNGFNYLLRGNGEGFAYETPWVALMQTSMASDGTWWGIEANNTIVRRNGTKWETVPGALVQVSVGSSGNIWGVNATNHLYRWSNGWIYVTGGITNVSAASDGTVWAINTNSEILRWNGGGFETMPGQAIQVAVGREDLVYVVNAQGNVYKWNIYEWEYLPKTGLSKAIAVASDGTAVVLRKNDSSAYRYP